MNREGHLLSTLLEGSQRSRSPLPFAPYHYPPCLPCNSFSPFLKAWFIWLSNYYFSSPEWLLRTHHWKEKNGKNEAVLGSWWEYCSEFIKNKEDLIREGFLSSLLPYLESTVSLHHVRPWKRLLGWTRKISHFLAMSSITQLNTQPTAEDEQQQQQQKIGEASKRAQIKMTEIR